MKRLIVVTELIVMFLAIAIAFMSVVVKDNSVDVSEVIPEAIPEDIPELIPEDTHNVFVEVVPEVKPLETEMNLLKRCLKEDKVDENEYVLYKYMCGHFSEDACYGVNSCFRRHDSDLRMYPCIARRPGVHFVTAIEIGNTWYIIEPQTDEIHELSVYSTFYEHIVVGRYLEHFRGGSEIRGVIKTLKV